MKTERPNDQHHLRLGVVGFGRVGRACAEAMTASKDLVLAALVRRFDRLAQPLPEVFSTIPVVSHVAQVPEMDAALLCVPIGQVREAARNCLQQGVPIVECALLHGEAFHVHRDAIDRFVTRFNVPAIVGAGWDPGALSVMRSLFGLLAPQGESEMRQGVAALEQEGRGVAIERRSAPGGAGHQRFLFEARFDEAILTAHMMLAAARALPGLRPGTHSLLDLPVGALWGAQAQTAERIWL